MGIDSREQKMLSQKAECSRLSTRHCLRLTYLASAETCSRPNIRLPSTSRPISDPFGKRSMNVCGMDS